MNIGSILWPESAKEACALYLGFAVEVVEEMEFRFPDFAPDPIAIAKAYVGGKISENEYRSESTPWWNHLDETGAIRVNRDPVSLAARLAICLLSASTDQANQLGEHLSWFLEVLGFLGADLSNPLGKMSRYFASQD